MLNPSSFKRSIDFLASILLYSKLSNTDYENEIE